MNHLFVSYEIALNLKKLGFDEPCFGNYFKGGKLSHALTFETVCNYEQYEVKAPLYQQVVDWVREKKDIEIISYKMIGAASGLDEVYIGRICRLHATIDDFNRSTKNVYDTYYEALNAAIEIALKLI